VCPAMHTEMWEHPAVQENLATLRRRGVHVVEPTAGRLAGGDSGAGRLAAPETIVVAAERLLTPPDLKGRRVLVTAGGTREPIDAVRVISNRSSGKQGYAVAAEASARGAAVTLVTTIARPVSGDVEVVRVETAAEMAAAVFDRIDEFDVLVMAAAVADFRPVRTHEGKIKKSSGPPRIELEPTVDILAGVGERRRPNQVLVGFAAETSEMADNARMKLAAKHIDLIVANDVSAPEVGFEHDTNAVTIFGADGSERSVPLSDKRSVARAILDAVVTMKSSPHPPEESP